MPPHTESSATLRIGPGAQQRSGWSEHGLGGWQAWGTTRASKHTGDDGDLQAVLRGQYFRRREGALVSYAP
jgi:hypothetical protein